MDPVDKEKPWTPLGQLVLLTLVIGVVYLIFRFAVVIPDWGWQIVAAVTGVGVLLYYQLAFRQRAKTAAPVERRMPSAIQIALRLLLVLLLTAPIAVVLYFVWLGGSIWR